jgi:sodium transport system permease protein
VKIGALARLAGLATVARKELVDAARDRRAILTLVIGALLGPVLISSVLNQRTVQKKGAERMEVPVVGAERASALVAWLSQRCGVTIKPAPGDAEAAVRGHAEELVLVVDPAFAGDFAGAHPASLRILEDSTRPSSGPKVQRLVSLLQDYGAELTAERLIAHGVAPQLAAPIRLETFDVASARERGAMLLNVLLAFAAMAIITSGMQIATHATAGERERGSLEALLLNGVARWQVAAGKWLAASVAAFVGLTAALLAIAWVISRLSLEALGLRVSVGVHEVLLLLAILAPLALLLPALQTYLSLLARSYKEAQSYTAILIVPVVVAAGLSTVYPIGDLAWARAVPLLGQYALGNDVLAGKAIPLGWVLAGSVECAAIAAVLVALAARLLSSEKLVFAR